MARPGFSFLVCPDVTLLKEELEKQVVKAGTESWSRQVFWGDEEPGEQFWQSLRQVGLFAENRIVIVRQAEAWPACVWKELSQILGQKIDHVWSFFCLEVDFEKGKFKIPAYIQKTPCFTYAEKKGWVWRSQGLAQNLPVFAREHAKKLDLKFATGVFEQFCANMPADAQAILNELNKFALVAENGNVTAAMLPETASSKENDAFGLIRKIQVGDLPGAWREIGKDTDGSLLFFMIAMLAREFRLLWQIEAGENPRMYPGDARFKQALARKLGFNGIARGFAALADAEWQVKSGRQRPEQTMEYLCAQMSLFFKSNANT